MWIHVLLHMGIGTPSIWFRARENAAAVGNKQSIVEILVVPWSNQESLSSGSLPHIAVLF